MVQRRDLNAPQGRKLAAAIRAARDAGRSSKTGAAGVVDYGETGNATWVDPATGEPASVRDLPPRIDETQQAIDEAKVELEDKQEQIDAAKQAILDEAAARAEALEVANGLLDQLEQRLNDGPTAEELEDIRTELGVVLGDAATAQAAAEAAQSAAETANANALAAAGIAADKGRIIYAPEPPTSEADRSTSNLWIDSDNGRVYVWAPEPAPGAWVESENESLRDAAQAAAAALAAAEAADARAGAAAAAAAAAQQAAEAAQTTANEATLDARDAWNEAVAAGERLESVWSSAARSFYWAGDRADEFTVAKTGHEIVAVPDAPASGSVLRKTGESWNSTGVDWDAHPMPFDPRALYRITFMVRVVTPATNIADPMFYAGVHAWTASPNGGPGYRIGTNGAGSLSSAHYFAASGLRNLTPADGWVTVTGYFQGHAPDGEVAGGRHNDMADPGFLRPEARYFSPMALIDYNRGNGVWELGMVAVDVVPAEVAAQAIAAKTAADAAAAQAAQAAEDATAAKELAEGAVREVGDTVREYVVEYAVGSSETAAPASGWSTSTPARTPGSFVWMRTVVTYADGDTSTTAPALLTGNAGSPGAPGEDGAPGAPGDDGAPGAPGVGLASTAVTYALSTSGTTAPSSGWTAAVPTLIKGRYLWTRSVWTYTNGTTETGYSVAYVPQDGADGDDGLPGAPGVGITGTTITYAASSSGTTAPSSGWAAQPPAATAGQYVWTRTVWTYSNGSTETGYAVGKIGNTGTPGAPGNDGAPGKDGLGIKSTVIAYALSTSATTAPTTGYTATVPTLIKGRYLWTRTLWTYTDNSTETGYSVAYVPQDGAKGDDGLPGAPGVGIASTAVTYAASSSGTVAPSSGWVAQPPAAAPGSFMWTRTVWTYTNGTTETGYSVGKIGETGSPGAPGGKGDTGVSVSSITPFFRAVARTAGAPAQPSGMTPSGWTTTEPAWSASTRLYRAERVVYSSGTVSWTPVTVVATYEGIVDVALSANGKNAITVSANAPTSGTPGVAAGDTWWRIDPDGVIFGQWRWTPLPVGWVPVTVRSEVIASLDVGKLVVTGSSRFTEAVVDNLWTNSLVAKVLTASRLVVASSNAYRDPALTESEPWLTGSQLQYVPGGGNGPGENGIRVVAGTSQRGGYDLISAMPGYPRTELEPGQTYDVSVWATPSAAHSGRGAAVYIRAYSTPTTTAGSLVTVIDNQGGMVDGWQRLHGEFTMPAGTRWVAVGLYINPPYTGSIVYSSLSIRPKVGSVLIEDGAVTADKIVADEVAAAVSHLVEARVEKLTVTAGATINEAVILKLAAEMITAGVLRTAATGQRVVIDSAGLVYYSGELDDNGAEVEAVRLGPSGENFLTIGSSSVSPDGVRAPVGTFDTLNVGGDDLPAMLESVSRRVVGWQRTARTTAYHGDTATEAYRVSVSATLEPGRMFRVLVPTRYVQTRAPGVTNVVEFLRYVEGTLSGRPNDQSPAIKDSRAVGITSTATSIPPIEGFYSTEGKTGPTEVTFMLNHRGSGVDARYVMSSGTALEMMVEDLGPAVSMSGSDWANVGNPVGGTSSAPPPTPEVTRRTIAWDHGGYGGDTENGNVYQGTLSSYGNRYGGWIFHAAMRSALSGSVIERFEIYLENAHWYNGAGGTARIVPNDGSYKGVVFGSTSIESTRWPRYAGRWVTLPSAWYPFIANGTYKGFSVYATSSSLVYYGRFKGAATKFRVTYRK